MPTINPHVDDAFGNAVKTALAAMTGVLHYDPDSGHWREFGDPFTFGGDTLRLALALNCDGNTVSSFYEKLFGETWVFQDTVGFATGFGGDYTFTCCQETWSEWRDYTSYPDPGSTHTETLTVTWTGNTCCRDGDGNCVHATGDCSGNCDPPSGGGSSADPCVVWKATYNCALSVWETEISSKTCDDPLVAAAAMDTWVRDGTTCDWYLKRLQSGGAPTPTHPASNESCCP